MSQWETGQTLYIKYRAEIGCLEKVVIKKVLLNGPFQIPIYKDTFNWLWNESELILQEEATQIVDDWKNLNC